MAKLTKTIGLSLGADLCWPICFEDIVRELNPEIRIGSDTHRFDVERVTIEPFSLQQGVKYDVVIDRLTHWYSTSREWIKKAVLMDGLYVLNNPWSVQSMEKQTSYCAMMRLGMPIPATWLVPPKEYEESADLKETLERYAQLFDLGEAGADLGYPLFMKPYDGGGWVGVNKVDDEEGLKKAYDKSGKFVMHLQAGIDPYERFVRCVGIGPQVRMISYDPSAPLHARYEEKQDFLRADDARVLRDTTLTINAFFGWDFNSCESLLRDGVWNPIDFANPCPDSQVTSLHVHFPWLVISQIRWALFVAATGRRFKQNLDWQPFFEIADTDRPFPEKLRAYGDLAERHFETERFEAFCDEHLSELPAIAWEYLGGDRAHDAVRQKVTALYPEHEVEEFTERFWQSIQDWRANHPAGSHA
ncbi:MAG: hypothetical protein GY711_23725 [bacterium]|nr:hypothetical protein [bacterium]